MKKGAFCISIDLELAWGMWDQLTPDHVRKCLDLERVTVHSADRAVPLYLRSGFADGRNWLEWTP